MKWIKWAVLIILAWLPGLGYAGDLVLAGANTHVDRQIYDNVTVNEGSTGCIFWNTTVKTLFTASESTEVRSGSIYAATFGAAAKTITAWCTGFETQTEAEIEDAGSDGTVDDKTDPEGNSTNVFDELAERDSKDRPTNPAYHKCNRSDAP